VSPEVYTPAFVVDGKLDAVGSDEASVDHALRQAALSEETAAAIDIQRGAAGLTVSVGAGTGSGTLLLIGYDRLHRTAVARGENSGQTLEEANICPLDVGSRQMVRQAGSSAGALPARTGCRSPPAAR
jgi:hypothetical protein